MRIRTLGRKQYAAIYFHTSESRGTLKAKTKQPIFMKKIVVYYGTSKGIWVSIDNSPPVNTEMATNMLIKGEVQVSALQRQRHAPVGLFARTGAQYKMKDGTPLDSEDFEPVNLSIDYRTIAPEDLQRKLKSRISSLGKYLVDPETEVSCIRGSPD